MEDEKITRLRQRVVRRLDTASGDLRALTRKAALTGTDKGRIELLKGRAAAFSDMLAEIDELLQGSLPLESA